jgi:hypothetical protein
MFGVRTQCVRLTGDIMTLVDFPTTEEPPSAWGLVLSANGSSAPPTCKQNRGHRGAFFSVSFFLLQTSKLLETTFIFTLAFKSMDAYGGETGGEINFVILPSDLPCTVVRGAALDLEKFF